MKHTLTALALTLFATAAGAAVESYDRFGATRADSPQECPAGTHSVSPNYDWKDGRLVRNGWVCQHFYRP